MFVSPGIGFVCFLILTSQYLWMSPIFLQNGERKLIRLTPLSLQVSEDIIFNEHIRLGARLGKMSLMPCDPETFVGP
eukprot:c14965_g2_i1 orf=37-267(+)